MKMGTAQKETEYETLKDIDELHDLEWEITERIHRGGGLVGSSSGANRHRGFVRQDFEGPQLENVSGVLPKHEDPKLVDRNRRMRENLIETLEAEREEGGESGIMMLQLDQFFEDKMRRDMDLRAIVANKAEEKISEVMLSQWSEHRKKLDNFLRTKAEPPIYYSFAKQLEEEEDPTSLEERKKLAFHEWEAAKREELSQYRKQVCEQNVANIDIEYERWLTGRKTHPDQPPLVDHMKYKYERDYRVRDEGRERGRVEDGKTQARHG